MSENDPSPSPPASAGPAPELQGLDAGELLARGLKSVECSPSSGSWTPPPPEEVGRLLPQYRIESLLGRGGMGAVYKGVQLTLDRPVAIKLLPAEVAADAQFVVRFQREARTLARLQHSRIVTIHDFGQTIEGHLYFVMEYIDGTNLRDILRGPGLNPEQALTVVGQLCDALQAAHREGIVHRDIKPENVLISRDGYVKLADFGLARPPRDDKASALTHTNVIMGTPDYMAPEQCTGAANADHRSDIFALGVMLYEMLTGQTPRGVFDPPSRKVRVDVRIDEVVLKALQAEPERRYQKASELKTDVDRIRTTPRPVPAPVARPGKGRKRPRRSQAPLAVAGVVLVLLALAGWGWWEGSREHREAALRTMVLNDLTPSPSSTPAAKVPAPEQSTAKEPPTSVATPKLTPTATPNPTPAATPVPTRAITAASTPAPAAENEPLVKALLAHAWTWTPAAGESPSWRQVVFWRDGTMTTSTPIVAHWTTTGPRSASLDFGDKNPLRLTFDPALGSFTGSRDDGKMIAIGRVASLPEATATVSPAAIPANSVWRDETRTLTILERQGDTFRARFDLGPNIVREISGSVKGSSISWLAKDVRAIKGGAGGDNSGTIEGDRIRFTWRDSSGPATVAGAYTLVRTATSPPPAVISGADLMATEQALIGSKWFTGLWTMQLLPNHVAQVDEGPPALRTWHWWVTGSHQAHIQYATDPAIFDSTKGDNFVFDSAYTQFTAGRLGALHGTRVASVEIHAPAAPAATGPASYSTGFDAPDFHPGRFDGQNSRWASLATGNGADTANAVRIEANVKTPENQAVLVSAKLANKAQTGFSARLTNEASIVRVQVDFFLNKSAHQTIWQFAAGDESATGGLVGGFNVSREDRPGQIITRGFPEAGPIISRGDWHRVMMTFDVKNQTFTVEIDHETVARDVPFVHHAYQVQLLQFSTFADGDDSAYFDNFAVTAEP